MIRTVRPEPTNLLNETKLDMRVSSALGRDLAEEITHSVEWSQKFIQMTLPDRLIVTQKQFASLQPYTEEMAHTEDRMYITPFNVMEVVIDRDVDIVDEVEQAMKDTEEMKASAKDVTDDEQAQEL